MNAMQFLASQTLTERMGWTLIHFLWQGALIAALYGAARRWLTRASGPNARYLLGCGALAVMALAPMATVVVMSPSSPLQVLNRQDSVITPAASPSKVESASIPVAPSGESTIHLLQWVVMIWLAGAIGFWIRLMGSWAVAAGMRSTQVRPAPREWQLALSRLGTRIGLSRPVRLLVSAVVQAPTVVGWIFPVVLMPIGALAGLPAEQVEALLIHELAHIRRHDYLVNILQGVAEALLFYHPAVWWVSGHIRTERELCCDDIAVSVSGDVLTYARALVELESFRTVHLKASANLAIGADGGSLAHRIGRLLGQAQPATRTRSGPGVVASALLIVATACAVCVVLSSALTAEAQTTASLQARDNLRQGIQAFSEARYEAATTYFQQALALDPALTEAQLNLAKTYSMRIIPGSQTDENQTLTAKAVDGFQSILNKDSNNVAAIDGLAYIYVSTSQFQKAREAYLRAEQLDPLNPVPFYSVGSVDWVIAFNKVTPPSPEEKPRIIEEGLQQLDIALTIQPEYGDAMTYKNLLLREKAMLPSNAAEKTNLIAEADQWFEKALENRRNRPPKPPSPPVPGSVGSGPGGWPPAPPPPPPPPPPARPGPR